MRKHLKDVANLNNISAAHFSTLRFIAGGAAAHGTLAMKFYDKA